MGDKIWRIRKLSGYTMRSSITSNNITWTFDQPYKTGQYVTGDYWVLDEGSGVTISSISPTPVYHATTGVNGSQKNPGAGVSAAHALDSRATWFQGSYNAGLGFVTPDSLSSGDSLLSSKGTLVSEEPLTDIYGMGPYYVAGTPGSPRPLRNTAILTCVGSIPSSGSFRPAYNSGATKTTYNISQINWTPVLAATLTPVSGQPSVATVQDWMSRNHINHITQYLGNHIRPIDHITGYGQQFCEMIGAAGWALCCNYTQEQKAPILYGLIQDGIDNYGIMETGVYTNRWYPAGAVSQGIIFPIILAGYLLDVTAMKNVDRRAFGETGATFYVVEDPPGVYNDGYGGYTADWMTANAVYNYADWGEYHQTNRALDSYDDWTSGYRVMNTAICWWGELLAVKVLGMTSVWNHAPQWDYQQAYRIKRGTYTPTWFSTMVSTYWDSY